MNTRNRLMLELVARGGMRVGEALSLTPADIQERSLTIPHDLRRHAATYASTGEELSSPVIGNSRKLLFMVRAKWF